MFSFVKRKPILDEAAQKRVVEALHEAERTTSGEIRLFIEHHCRYVNGMDRAREVFAHLKMENTTHRNAILIYIAYTDRQFALLGDHYIYEKSGGPEFWAKAAKQLTGHLKKDEITDGICNCIRELGIVLASHFPADPNIKRNHLPDEIVFGK